MSGSCARSILARLWRGLRSSALAVVATATIGSASSSANAASLVIGGTGIALGGMEQLASAFMQTHPDVHVDVLPSLGSSGGIRALLGNAIDIALSARPLKKAERAAGASDVEYTRTPIAFVTPPETAVAGVTTAELANIYAGEITTWPDGQPLRLILRPAGDTVTQLVRALSTELDRAVQAASARPGLIVAVTDQEAADALERLEGSFGAMTIAQLASERRRLKPLSLDGVFPSREAVASGDYPLAASLYLVTGSAPSPIVESFAAFVRSPEAQAMLAGADHPTARQNAS